MLTKQSLFLSTVCLLLGLVLGAWIGTSTNTPRVENDPRTRHAIRGVRITIDPSRQEDLFFQLQKFADKWRYAIRIAPLDPAGESFTVQMWRSDIMLSGLYPNDPNTLDIGFFYTNPAVPVPERYFDEEISDLEKHISEIPGSLFSVEK